MLALHEQLHGIAKAELHVGNREHSVRSLGRAKHDSGNILAIFCKQRLRINFSRLVNGRNAKEFQELFAILLCGRQRLIAKAAIIIRAADQATLYDRATEQANVVRAGYLCHNATTACGLAGDGHLLRIATERCDISLHPLQTSLLIQKTKVGRCIRLLCGQLGMCHETKDIQTIVDGYNDNATSCNSLAIELHLCGIAPLEATTEEPYDYGKLLVCRLCARPDIQVQTILIHGNLGINVPLTAVDVSSQARGVLHGDRCKRIALTNAVPVCCGLRCTPSVLTYGRRCKGNSLKRRVPGIRCRNTLHVTIFRLNNS